MADMTPEQAARVERLAKAMCNNTRRHAGGTGRHDADRWGPCATHEEAAAALLPRLEQEIEAARAEERRSAQVPAVFLADDHEECDRRLEAAGARIARAEALAREWTTATCQTDGAPCSWHRVAAECAAELREALDPEEAAP